MRGKYLNATIIQKLLIKSIAVIGLIANNAVRSVMRKAAVNGRLNQLYLMGRSAFNVSGDWNTSSVCDVHDLGAFATLCLADSKTPFLPAQRFRL